MLLGIVGLVGVFGLLVMRLFVVVVVGWGGGWFWLNVVVLSNFWVSIVVVFCFDIMYICLGVICENCLGILLLNYWEKLVLVRVFVFDVDVLLVVWLLVFGVVGIIGWVLIGVLGWDGEGVVVGVVFCIDIGGGLLIVGVILEIFGFGLGLLGVGVVFGESLLIWIVFIILVLRDDLGVVLCVFFWIIFDLLMGGEVIFLVLCLKLINVVVGVCWSFCFIFCFCVFENCWE